MNKEPSHKDRPHSKISPSKLHNLELSPMFEQDPQAEEHWITSQGTRCHEALDSGDDSKLENDDERQWVDLCRQHVTNYAADYPESFNELKIDIIDGIWGFADLAMVNRKEKKAILFDFKFGRRKQEATETNAACQAYVYGLFAAYPWLEVCDVEYLYPVLGQRDCCQYTTYEIPKIHLRLKTIIARVEEATTCNPYPETCQYCRKIASCGAVGRYALPVATRYAESHSLGSLEAYDPGQVTDPGQVARMFDAAKILEKWCDSVKFHALNLRLETGQEIPGYELRSRAGKKKVVNPQLAYQACIDSGIVSHEDILNSVEISASKLFDAAREHAPRGQKDKQAVKLENLLRDSALLEESQETQFLQRK